MFAIENQETTLLSPPGYTHLACRGDGTILVLERNCVWGKDIFMALKSTAIKCCIANESNGISSLFFYDSISVENASQETQPVGCKKLQRQKKIELKKKWH